MFLINFMLPCDWSKFYMRSISIMTVQMNSLVIGLLINVTQSRLIHSHHLWIERPGPFLRRTHAVHHLDTVSRPTTLWFVDRPPTTCSEVSSRSGHRQSSSGAAARPGWEWRRVRGSTATGATGVRQHPGLDLWTHHRMKVDEDQQREPHVDGSCFKCELLVLKKHLTHILLNHWDVISSPDGLSPVTLAVKLSSVLLVVLIICTICVSKRWAYCQVVLFMCCFLCTRYYSICHPVSGISNLSHCQTRPNTSCLYSLTTEETWR